MKMMVVMGERGAARETVNRQHTLYGHLVADLKGVDNEWIAEFGGTSSPKKV